MSDSLNYWLENACRTPLLSNDEVVIHARRIAQWKAGVLSERQGMKSLNRIVSGNLRLIYSLWTRNFSFIGSLDPLLMDMLQEGTLGLREAALRYDPTTGYRFSTYANRWIWKFMNDAKLRASVVTLTSDCVATVNSANKLIAMEIQAGRPRPSMAWLSEKLNRTEGTIEGFMKRAELFRIVPSLDANVNCDEKHPVQLSDLVPTPAGNSPELLAHAERCDAVLQSLMNRAQLTSSEQELVRGRALQSVPLTLKDYADRNGISSSQASRVFKRAISRMSKVARPSDATVLSVDNDWVEAQ